MIQIRNPDIAVVTVPISPPSKDKPGILSLCVTADMLSQKLGGNNYLYLNIMNSYKDLMPRKEKFEVGLRAIGLDRTNLRLDIDHQSHIRGNIETLIQKGYVTVEKTEILSCSCGRIDCKSDFVDDLKGETQFKKEDGALVCNSCETACTTEEKDVLVLKMPGTEKLPTTAQEYLAKEMETLRDKFAGQSLVISKKRNTGYVFNYEGQDFNIDVDFCLYNYLSAIPEKKKVVVGSSHIVYQMYMMNLVESLCNPDADLTFLPIAHIGGTADLNIHDDTIRAQDKMLYLASAFRLTKETNWPSGKIDFITKKPTDLLDAIHGKMTEYVEIRPDEGWETYVRRIVSDEMNMDAIRGSETKKYKRQLQNKETSLYETEVKAFLDSFGITIEDVKAVWRQEKTFLSPDKLLQALAKDRHEGVQKLAQSALQPNEMTNAFVRMDFIVGLADIYAREMDSTTTLIEVDTINSNGAGKILGSDRMYSVFGKVNDIFMSTLKEYGATTVFAIDHAKNDDYRIITTGLESRLLRKALAEAQKKVDEFFIFASDFPHSKYETHWGLGAGYGSRLLGKDTPSEDMMLFCLENVNTKRQPLQQIERIFYLHIVEDLQFLLTLFINLQMSL